MLVTTNNVLLLTIPKSFYLDLNPRVGDNLSHKFEIISCRKLIRTEWVQKEASGPDVYFAYQKVPKENSYSGL